MQQVAVGGVHLDTVETGVDRVAGGGHEVGDQAGDLVGLGRTGYVVGLAAVGGHHLARRLHGARRDGLHAVLVVGVRDAAGVHQLGDDDTVAGVHGVGDEAPAGDLLVGVEARDVEVALADLARARCPR